MDSPIVTPHSDLGPLMQRERVRGMYVSVKLLRDNGRRLSREEWGSAQPLVGRLRIYDTERERNGRNIKMKIAELKADRGGSLEYGLRQPIFDPVLIAADEKGFVLRGYEVCGVADGIVETVQLWLVTPIAPTE